MGEILAGRYELLEPLGEGGMAVVVRARQVGLDRFVAVKLLRDHLAGDPEQCRRFLREARNGARLVHPGIVGVIEVGDSPRPFIVMDCVEGSSLRELLARRLPLPRGLALMVQVAEALAAAHAEGVVHRDLKPENILVTPQDQARIGDWGLSRALDDPAGLTKTGVILGTPAYMSPERFTSPDVAPPADLYALGCMLYELADGSPPLASAPVTDLVRSRLTLPPTAPTRGSAPFRALALLLLAKNPEDRPTAAETAERLASLPELTPDGLPAPAAPTLANVPAAPGTATQAQPRLAPRSLPTAESRIAPRPPSRILAPGPRTVPPPPGRRLGAPLALVTLLLVVLGLLARRSAPPTALPDPTVGHQALLARAETPQLVDPGHLSLRIAEPVVGFLTLRFETVGGETLPQPAPMPLDLSSARPAGRGFRFVTAALSTPLTTAAVAVLTDERGGVSRSRLDPAPLIDRLLAPVDALTAEATAALSSRLGALRGVASATEEGRAQASAQFAAEAAALGLDDETCLALRRGLPPLCRAAGAASPLGWRLRRLVLLEAPLRPHGVIAPWGSLIDALGYEAEARNFLPPMPTPGWDRLHKGQWSRPTGGVTRGDRQRIIFTWLGSPGFLASMQDPTKQSFFAFTAQGVFGDDVSAEQYATVADVKPEATYVFDAVLPPGRPWPPTGGLALSLIVRFYDEANYLELRANGRPPLVVPFASLEPTNLGGCNHVRIPVPAAWFRPGANSLVVSGHNSALPGDAKFPMSIKYLTLEGRW